MHSSKQTSSGKTKDMTKKKYTRKYITEAIAYWEKQLRDGNYKKLDESLEDCDSLDEVYGELDSIIEQDKALKNKLAKLYKAENPGWKGKWNDDDYVNWRGDFIIPMFDRTMLKAIKSGVDKVLSDVKAAVDKKLQHFSLESR